MIEVTETLLEMHFHRAIVKSFQDTYGAKFLRLLKPSTRNEVWVGFDQGWSRTTLSSAQLYDQLRQAIAADAGSVNGFYFGYFMQFKVVRAMERLSRFAPSTFAAPYFRSELSLEPSPTTGLSQHDTLLRLCRVAGADVNYVCPMMFDLDQLYEEPDIDQLQVVDLRSAPAGWTPTERHFIAFQTPYGAAPQWCSESVPASARKGSAWVESTENQRGRRNGPQILSLIETSVAELRQAVQSHDGVQLLPAALTIVEFEPEASVA